MTDLDDLIPGGVTYVRAEPGPREILIQYLRMKVDECDWHAVADAANDLRVLEARNPSGGPHP